MGEGAQIRQPSSPGDRAGGQWDGGPGWVPNCPSFPGIRHPGPASSHTHPHHTIKNKPTATWIPDSEPEQGREERKTTHLFSL